MTSDRGTWSTRGNPPPNPKSLATISHAPVGIQTYAGVATCSQYQCHRPFDHQGRPSTNGYIVLQIGIKQTKLKSNIILCSVGNTRDPPWPSG